MNDSSNLTTVVSNFTPSVINGHNYRGGIATQILFAIIAILSIVGNFLIIILFLHSPRLKRYSHGILIWNLALVDMLTGIFIIVTPVHIIRQSYQHPPPGLGGTIFCKIIGSEILTFSFGFISMYNLAALSIERRYAVVDPNRYPKYFTIKNIKIMIVFVWIWGIILNINNIFQTHYDQFKNPPCQWNKLGNKEFNAIMYTILFILRFLLPMLCVIFCYSNIYWHIRSTVNHLSKSFNKEQTSTYKLRNRVTFTCAITSIAFIMCWLPNQIYFTFINLNFSVINDDLHFITKLLILFNSCINPFIYACTNPFYRHEFVIMIKNCHSFRHRRVFVLSSAGGFNK